VLGESEFWNFDGQTFINPLVLFPQVHILFPKFFDLLLDFIYDLILLVHLDHRLVPDVHRARCVVEG
jgi:hypothetical protein